MEFKNITQLHESFEAKKTSPLEVIDAYLQKCKDDQLNACLTVCEDYARDRARELEKSFEKNSKIPRSEMPLFGVPIGVKDVLCLEGVRNTCGSKILENYVPPYTATVLKHLEDAGAVIVGKFNLDEFAMGSSNENSAFGRVIHPTHPDRVPGGSSGGSAAAVKAGLCLGSLGTDTGGSIRLPASFCGVVGFKPTYGRVSRYGMVAFASSLEQVGPFANNIGDAARILHAIAGRDPRDSTTAPVEKGNWISFLDQEQKWDQLKVGVPQEYFIDGVTADVKAAVQKSIDWMKSRGAKIVPLSLPHTRYAVPVYYVVAVSEASSNLARFDGVRFGERAESAKDLDEFYEKTRSLFGPEVKLRILLGTFALSSGYYDAYYKRACQVRRLIKQDFDEAFQKVNVIVSPTSPVTAFKAGEKSEDPLKMYLSDIFTISANLAGIPAVSMPCGVDSEGLPIGIQFMAPHFKEGRLVSIADSFEREYQ